MMLSTSQKYAAKMKTVTRTTRVVDWTSARDGEITLRISLRTSLRNSTRRAGCDFRFWSPVLVCSVTATVLAIVTASIFVLLRDLLPDFEGRANWRGSSDSNREVRFWRPTV